MKYSLVCGVLSVAFAFLAPDAVVASSIDGRQSCSDSQMALIAEDLETHADFNGLRLVVSACSVAPKQLGASILVYVALNSEGEGNLTVSIRDGREVVLARSSFPVIEDATLRFSGDSVSIDVAPYVLSNSTRAFGVDITSGYIPNCGDGGWGAVRTLYEVKDHKIVPVLQGLSITEWVFIQQSQWRCVSDPNAPETTIIEHFSKTIQPAKSSTNGRRDLVIVGKSELEYLLPDGSQEIKHSGRALFRFVLKYDGERYPLDELEKAWWMWRA